MKKLPILITALLGTAAGASAQNIIEFGFPDLGGGSATFVDASMVSSVSNFSGSGTANLSVPTFSGSPVNVGPGVDAAGTPYSLGTTSGYFAQVNGFAETFDANDPLYGASAANYVSFSFTAADNISLASLAFDVAQGGGSAPRGFTLTYDVGNTGNFDFLGVAAYDGGNNLWGRYSFDFTNASLSSGTEVEVRFHGFSTGAGNSIRFDNVTVAAVPEPSTYALLAGIIGAFAVYFRRRRK